MLVIVVALIALGALGMAAMFRQEVLAAGEGSDNMKTIALAVQEGANAYLQRQFRTLAIFAAIAFFALLALPADDAWSGSSARCSSSSAPASPPRWATSG